jgi:GxxExxY protein
MDADKRRYETDKITEKVIGCIFKVSNKLGCGFLEKIYENAMVLELHKSGLNVKQQYGVTVKYEGVVIGEFAADLLVEDCVIIELKAVKSLDEIHQTQCMNYLKATGLPVCLLVNFGKPKAEIKRIVNNF